MSKHAPVKAFPKNVTNLEEQRIVKRTVTLLDEVEQTMLVLFEDPKYRTYREALDTDTTVEGSIFADDVVAAQMIRNKAEEMGLRQVMEANLTTISQKLRRAEARFNASRNQRKQASS